MKKIAFVVGGMKRGGAERVISILSREYAKRGWEVSIIQLLFPDVEYLLDDKITIVDLSGNISSRIRRLPYWVINIRKYLRRKQINTVVSFVTRVNIITLFSTMGLKMRKIVSERNDPVHDGRGLIARMLLKPLYLSADGIVFQTERSMRYFNKQIVRKGTIIYNPIEVSKYARNVASHKIVSVGRLESQKNHKLLIYAFSEIVKMHPEYELWIYGEGKLRSELTEQIISLGLVEKVFLPGIVKDVHDQISDAEIFVLSSDYEGLSNALMEAMMMGLPCISTDCAGSDEIIENGINGLLVSVGDKTALCVAINMLIKNEKLRHKIANTARETSKRFSTERIFNEWQKVIG